MLYLCELYIDGKLWEYGVFDSVYKCLDWAISKGMPMAKERNCKWDYYISEYVEE